MAYFCYRATESGCANCEHCRFDPERGEKACFAKEVTDEEQYYNFLEWLRKSGQTNMYGATPYLMAEFPELSLKKAEETLEYWMAHYDELSVKYFWNNQDKMLACIKANVECNFAQQKAHYLGLEPKEILKDVYHLNFLQEWYLFLTSGYTLLEKDKDVITWLSKMTTPLDRLYQMFLECDDATCYDWDAMYKLLVSFMEYEKEMEEEN